MRSEDGRKDSAEIQKWVSNDRYPVRLTLYSTESNLQTLLLLRLNRFIYNIKTSVIFV
jgi:hypothetical protein